MASKLKFDTKGIHAERMRNFAGLLFHFASIAGLLGSSNDVVEIGDDVISI